MRSKRMDFFDLVNISERYMELVEIGVKSTLDLP